MKSLWIIQPLLSAVLFTQSIAQFARADENSSYREIRKRDLLTWSVPKVALSEEMRVLKPISGDHALYSMIGLSEEEGMNKKTSEIEKRFSKQNLRILDETTRISKTLSFETISTKNVDALARETRAARLTIAMAAKDYPQFSKLEFEKSIYRDAAAKGFSAAKAAGLVYTDLPSEHHIRRAALILATLSNIDNLKTTGEYKALYQRMVDIRAITLANFKNSDWRMQYDINSGKKLKIQPKLAWWDPKVRYAVKEGVVYIQVQDPKTGKYVTRPLTVVSADDYRQSASTLVQNLKSGLTVISNVGLAALSYSLVLGAAAVGKLILAGNASPAALEEALATYGNAAFGYSMLGFMFSNMAVDKALYPMVVNLQRLQALQTKDPTTGRRFLEGNPMRTAVLRDTVMQLNLFKNALGIGVSTALGIYNAKMAACNDLTNDKPMTAAVREQKKADCDRGYLEYLSSAAPQTILQILMYAGIQKTFFFFGHLKWIKDSKNPENITVYQNAEIKNVADDLAKSPESRVLTSTTVIPEELAAVQNSMSKAKTFTLLKGFLRGVYSTSIQMALFTVVMDVSQRILGWGIPTTTTAFNLTRGKIAVDRYVGNLIRAGFTEAAYCGNTGKITDDEDTCNSPVTESLNNYGVTRENWRNVVTSGFQTRLNDWNSYFQKAINTAKASRIFYSDVTSQITAAKKQNKKIAPLIDGSGTLKAEHYVKYAFEELPLFRTQPLFGVRPELMDKSWLVAGKKPDEKVLFSWTTMTEKQKESSKKEIETNLLQKSATVIEGGRWLKTQLNTLTSTAAIKKDLLNIANLMDSQKKSFDQKLIDQTQALLILQQRVEKYSNISRTCESGKFDQTGLCFYSQVQSRLGDVLVEAANFLRERMKKKLIADQHAMHAQSLIGNLSSFDTDSRRAGIEQLLRLVRFSGTDSALACTSEQLRSKDLPKDCTLQAMLAMIDANNTRDIGYLPEIRISADVTRLAKLAPFNYRLNADTGGFKQLNNKTPTGPYPLSWGHKYLMNFFVTLKDYGVETEIYPESIGSVPNESISQFLMMSTMCGPNTMNRETAVVEVWAGFKPKFYPPRLSMIQDLDYCAKINNAEQSQNAYHKILSVTKSRTWYGFADLLYHNVSDQVLDKKFAPWWMKTAELPLENLIIKDAQRAYKGQKVLGLKTAYGIPDLARIMLYGDGGLLVKASQHVDRSVGMPRNLVEVVKEEFNYYFRSVLKPVYESSKTGWYAPSMRVWKYEHGLPSKLVKDYTNDENFKKYYLENLRIEFLGHLELYLSKAVDVPEVSMQHFISLVRTFYKLKTLFYVLNEEEVEVFSALIDKKKTTSDSGHFTVYPVLSLKMHPTFTKTNEYPIAGLLYDTMGQMEQAIYNMMPIVGSAAQTKNIVEELAKF